MSLSVATLAGFPAINTTLQRSAGTPTVGITNAYTNGVYTPTPGTVYVAGILDSQGVNPSRIFFADNNTGGGTVGATVPLPTLVSVTEVSAHGQSIQNLEANSFAYNDNVGYSGFIVVLTPAEPSADSGGRLGGYYGGTTATANGAYTLTEVPGYTAQAPTKGYPQPQMRYFVTLNALLIIASTSTG